MSKTRSPRFYLSETLAEGTPMVLSKNINHRYHLVSALLTLDKNAQFHVMGLSNAGGEYMEVGTLTWTVADGDGEVNVAALHRDLLPGGQLYDAAARVVAGYSIEWDGRNWLPYLTPDARDAYEEINQCLSLTENRYLTGREVWDAGAWLYEFAHDTLTGAESDDALKALAKQWEADAGVEGVVLVGDPRKLLQEISDEKRGELINGGDETTATYRI